MNQKKLPSKARYYAVSILAVLCFLTLWYLATDVFHLFRYNMLPSPVRVFQSFITK